MKKWIIAFVICFVATQAFAAKPTTYTKVQDIGGRFQLNYQLRNEKTGVIEYCPMALQLWCQAITADGGARQVSVTKAIGTPREIPFTNKEIYNLMPTQMKSAMKDLIVEAINEDISQ